jgi:hypothetical protein
MTALVPTEKTVVEGPEYVQITYSQCGSRTSFKSTPEKYPSSQAQKSWEACKSIYMEGTYAVNYFPNDANVSVWNSH